MILKSILDKGISQITDATRNEIIKNNTTFSANELSFGDWMYTYRYEMTCASLVIILIIIALFIYVRSKARYYEIIEQKSQEQEKATQATTDFFSRMSHDMRTPMNGILGMTELSEDEQNNEILMDNMHKIHESGKYLLGLINDTLDYQKIEAGRMTLAPTIIKIGELIQGCLGMVKTTAEKKGVNLIFKNVHSDLMLIFGQIK